MRGCADCRGGDAMSDNLRRYTHLLRESGQLERLDLSEKPLERGFFTLLGFLLGLAVAWWLR
jgi:hypothetical protein